MALRFILLLNHDVVKEPPLWPEDLRDGLAQQTEVVLFQPLIIETAWELHRQFYKFFFLLQLYRFERLKPRLVTLPVDVVPNNFETLLPDGCGGLLHSRGSTIHRSRCPYITDHRRLQ